MLIGLREELSNMECFSSQHDENTLAWMREATRELERLDREVESLRRVLDGRTAHLA